ncbi:hypothetical protein NL676_039434 [Syzygium grande]|nr:hypothetical protein NL676_039434 [Syzygium grande]
MAEYLSPSITQQGIHGLKVCIPDLEPEATRDDGLFTRDNGGGDAEVDLSKSVAQTPGRPRGWMRASGTAEKVGAQICRREAVHSRRCSASQVLARPWLLATRCSISIPASRVWARPWLPSRSSTALPRTVVATVGAVAQGLRRRRRLGRWR